MAGWHGERTTVAESACSASSCGAPIGEIQGYIGRYKGDIRYRRHLVVHLVQIRDRVGLGLGSGLGFRLGVKVRARVGG